MRKILDFFRLNNTSCLVIYLYHCSQLTDAHTMHTTLFILSLVRNNSKFHHPVVSSVENNSLNWNDDDTLENLPLESLERISRVRK